MVGSCSTSVDSADTTAGSTAPDSTAAGSSLAATDPDLTVEDLEAILPVASDLGGDYQLTADDDDDDAFGDDEFETAMAQACPKVLEFGGADEADDDRVQAERHFATADDQELQVTLRVVDDADDVDEQTIQDWIDAIDGCVVEGLVVDEIEFEIRFAAEVDDSFGDVGLRFEMLVHGDHPSLPQPVQIETVTQVFVTGGVEAVVAATGSADDATLDPIPADTDTLAEVAVSLDEDLVELTGG